MTFRLKAWQIYVICVLVLSFPVILILNGLGHESGEGLGYDMESAIFTTGVIGGIVTGLYYVLKWHKESKKEKEKLKSPIS